MPSGFLVKLHPTGPWRIGPDSGARDRVDLVYHSDAVYSAVTGAMLRLGHLEAWLRDTAENERGSAVRFSSCYPFHRDALLVTPPRSLWPPPPSAKLRYKGARFIPLPLVASLLAEQPIEEDRWTVDGASECLLPSGKHHSGGPFRVALRSQAAVDRIQPGRIITHATACLEFAEGAGLWMVVAFADEAAREHWAGPVRAALRLLADSGFGGERSLGWGRSRMPQITEGELPDLIVSTPSKLEDVECGYWLLSLFTPSAIDTVDWKRGNYKTVVRSGRVESPARCGDEKRPAHMVAEGSVLIAASEPHGAARDVAPPDFPHPVFRAGFAVAISIPWRPAV